MCGKKLLHRALQSATISVALFVPQVVMAQVAGTGGVLRTSLPTTIVAGTVGLGKMLILILNFFAWFLLSLLEIVMNPEFMFGMNADAAGVPNMNLVNMLHEIWQFTRDLVNIGFAMALIVGAIMMIVTADGSKLKEHAKNFVIAIVLVNFSWFIPRVIFDVSQVLTYTVYQIPSLMNNGGACTRPPEDDEEGDQPCDVVVDYRFLEGTEEVDDGVDGWKCPFKPLVCYRRVPINRADVAVSGTTRIFHGLVVNHARLQWLIGRLPTEVDPALPPNAPLTEVLQILASTVLKVMLVLILHIAIVFPLAAMVAAFFIRIPVIWISMAFMPLVALGFAFPKLREGEYGDLFWKWQEHFLQAVFLPAKVAIPFVIGFIMVNAGANLPPPPAIGPIPVLSLFAGVRDLWQFLWMGIALFIIWKYSFQALAEDKAGFMGHFTETIKGVGSGIGSFAAQAPFSIPFIPVPGRGNQSPLALSHALDPRRAASHMRSSGELPRMDALFRDNRTRPPQNQAIQKIMTSHDETITIQQTLSKGTGAGTPADQTNALRQSLQQLQRHHGTNAQFQTLSNRQVLEELLRVGALSTAEQTRIRTVLDNPNNAGLMAAEFRTPVL